MASYDAYVAAKAGITGLTRGSRGSWPDRIRVNAVMPRLGPDRAPTHALGKPRGTRRLFSTANASKSISPPDLVAASLLASNLSRMMTGKPW
jgi:NAD(P)-dependent dehydrogenase (short-subunit alcohol dehydrogenase family)